jgi:ferredoxin
VPDPAHPASLSIAIDRELCMGSGMCIMYAPSTFAHDDGTKAVVIDPTGDSIEGILTAAEGCPTGALTVRTEGEGK